MNNKGFSLVELIIVVAIMAVLIGVLAPQYLKYVQKSKVSTDINNAQEIADAVNAAIADEQIMSGTSFGGKGGDMVVSTDTFTVDNLKTLPISKINKDFVWEITYSTTEGVTSITLGTGTTVYEIYPNPNKDPGGYYTEHMK